MKCPHCNADLVEARVRILPGPRLQPARVVVDPHGDRIKVKCGGCGRFYGYKPVKEMRANGNG